MHREYDPSQMGLGHHIHREDAPSEAHDPEAERRWLVMTTVVVGVLLAAHLAAPFWDPSWQRLLGVPLALWAAIIGGGRVVYLALAALLEGRIGADIALAIACVAAAVLGEYFVAAEVVFIALVGECLEASAFERAQGAIQRLLDIDPPRARMLRDGQEIEVAAADLAVGDHWWSGPASGSRPTAWSRPDGRASTSRVLTGEGLPVDKGPGRPGLHRHVQPVRPARSPGRHGGRPDDARPGHPPAGRGLAAQVAAWNARPTATPGCSCRRC